jgi:hypothetical protein
MHRFEYRIPRTATSFSVDFTQGEVTLHGLCRDVSQQGIRADLDGPVLVGTTGILVLRHSAGAIKLEAQVAYVENGQAGLTFVFHAAHERGTIHRLIAAIADAPANLHIIRPG